MNGIIEDRRDHDPRQAAPAGADTDSWLLVCALLDKIANLYVALTTRDTIGQAKGVLIERHKIGPDEAFGVLRVASQHTNRRLREVAEELLWTGQLPATAAGADPEHT